MSNNQLILNESIAQGLDIIGDRWTLLILQEAFYGRKRFEEFRQHTGASRSTLTRRLNALVDNDIFYKHPYSGSTSRFEYKFTEKGLGLLGASLLAVQWEADWHTEGYIDPSNRLFHTLCGNYMTPAAVCRQCQQAIQLEDVAWKDLDETLNSQLQEIRACNSKRRKRDSAEYQDSTNANLASLIGDRWSLLMLIAAFLGTSRYDDFAKQLGIAPGILAERLKYLIANDIFTRRNYQTNPPRFEYKLTTKGKSLYPFIMTLRQWIIDNLPEDTPTPSLIHTQCGKPLIIDIVCGDCHHIPWPKDLRFKTRPTIPE